MQQLYKNAVKRIWRQLKGPLHELQIMGALLHNIRAQQIQDLKIFQNV